MNGKITEQEELNLRDVMESVPASIGVYRWGTDGKMRLITANRAFRQMFGLLRAQTPERIEQLLEEGMHPADRRMYQAALRALSQDGSLNHIYRHKCAGESYRWLRMVCTARPTQSNGMLVYASYTDITRRKQEAAEADARHHSLRMQFLEEDRYMREMAGQYLCAMRYDLGTDRIDSVIDNTITGNLLENGMNFHQLQDRIHPLFQDEASERHFWEQASPERVLKEYAIGNSRFQLEQVMMIHGYGALWVQLQITVRRNPDTGRLVAFIMERNISDLRRMQLIFRTTAEQDYDFVLCINQINGKYHRYVGPDFADLPEEDSYAERINAFLSMGGDHPDEETMALVQLPAVCKRLEQVPMFRHAYDIETTAGQRRYVLQYSRINEGRDAMILMTRRDVTELLANEQENKNRLERALEEAQSANKAKSEFLSRMSHDIRTPMNAIIGLTAMASEHPGNPEETTSDLAKISQSSHFLLGLINDVLDMAKIESEALEFHKKPYPLSEFLSQIDMLIRPLCTQKNLQFTCVSIGAAVECIEVDQLRFNQIFFNLLSNAVKFTPSGGHVSLGIDFQLSTAEYVDACFTVRDDGAGMSDVFQAHMYDAFSQEENDEVNPASTGLGLAIVKRLVELMHGTISVHSVLGEGSVFTVHLPLTVCALPRLTDGKMEKIDLMRLKGRRVLLCEDHPLNTEIVVRLLNKQSMEVVCAANGREGVETFAAAVPGTFDAILMDIRMPVMDGIAATHSIRGMAREDAKTIPILAMTANAFANDRQETLMAGMNEHLNKPIEPNRLYEALLRCIH